METLPEKRRVPLVDKVSTTVLEKVKEICTESNLPIPDLNIDRAHPTGKVYFDRIKKANCRGITQFVILLSVIEYCCVGPKTY